MCHAEPEARKGKTLAEIEEEEGGPVKESLVGMAQVRQATPCSLAARASAAHPHPPAQLPCCCPSAAGEACQSAQEQVRSR
jgi:hypothetical protein